MAVEEPRRVRWGDRSIDRFVAACAAGLHAAYAAAIPGRAALEPEMVCSQAMRYVLRACAVLVASERVERSRPVYGPLRDAARAVVDAAHGGCALSQSYDDCCRSAADATGMDLLRPEGGFALSDIGFAAVSEALLLPRPDAPFGGVFYQTMPVSWLGHTYQSLLAYRPDESGECLRASRGPRRDRGVFFTPPWLVNYIVESVLAQLSEQSAGALVSNPGTNGPALRVLDPSMGGGDFLSRAVEYLAAPHGGASAAECVYGVDIDPTAVEIARFAVWAASGFAEGVSEVIASHLVCADAIGGPGSPYDWAGAFHEVFERSEAGFDAVVGNPPYIAAKNGFAANGLERASRGQSDSYLLFLSTALESGLVRSGGLLSMVLPDPVLVRANAAGVRRTLLENWTLVSLLHVLGAFPEARVANVVPVFRNARANGGLFSVCRIERAADRRSVMMQPAKAASALARPVRRDTVLAQPRRELLYLLDDGEFGRVVRRIHGERASLAHYQAPFAPLRDLNVKTTYRGEEVGKSSISSETGDLPMLLGGQSVHPYEIEWEGRRIVLSRVKKPLERYRSTKILLQKSSARLIAALDRVGRRHPGYVFPQSVYAIELRPPGMHELYLLCILNSEMMNEYIRRAVTGYKMVQPQIELEDIRALPIRRISFTTPYLEREKHLAEAVGIYEEEALRSGEGGRFPEMDNFVACCLTGNPERSDVVHDLLVHLGGLVVDLMESSRRSPDADTTRRLASARAAVETVVWRLYSSEPAQMALPW